jgi:hypothetical protein
MIYYLNYYQKKQDQYGNNYFPETIYKMTLTGMVNIPVSSATPYSIYDKSSNTAVTSTSSFGYVMNMMKVAINENNAFNDELVRTASISLSGPDPIIYDSTKEMHLPQKLMEIYDAVNDTVSSIADQILNTNNLLDIVNILFDNGIEARIAVDSIGIAEGGSLLNEIQETILLFCKMIMPPSQSAYIISDNCLGTFALDRNRELAIKSLSNAIGKFKDVCDEINRNTKKYKKIEKSYKQFQYSLEYEVGIICSHIDDNWEKINKMNLEEFTTSRIEQVTEKFLYIASEINMLIISIQ